MMGNNNTKAKKGKKAAGTTAADTAASDPLAGVTVYWDNMGTGTPAPTERDGFDLHESNGFLCRIPLSSTGTGGGSGTTTVPAPAERLPTRRPWRLANLTPDRLASHPEEAAMYGNQNSSKNESACCGGEQGKKDKGKKEEESGEAAAMQVRRAICTGRIEATRPLAATLSTVRHCTTSLTARNGRNSPVVEVAVPLAIRNVARAAPAKAATARAVPTAPAPAARTARRRRGSRPLRPPSVSAPAPAAALPAEPATALAPPAAIALCPCLSTVLFLARRTR